MGVVILVVAAAVDSREVREVVDDGVESFRDVG